MQRLRAGLAADPRFADLEFAFDAGGMIRAAMNQGKSSPINVRVTGKDPLKARAVAEAIRREVAAIDGVVDARIIQRLDYPAVRHRGRSGQGRRPRADASPRS